MRREIDKRKIVIESDQTSLLINEEKLMGKVKYKTPLSKKKVKHFFLLKKLNKIQAKKHQQPRVRGTVIDGNYNASVAQSRFLDS